METVMNLENGWYILQDVHDTGKNRVCTQTEKVLQRWDRRFQSGKN